MSKAAGNAPLDRDIRAAIARTLWVVACGRSKPSRTMGATPTAADRAAVDLIELYEAVNDRVLVDFYEDWIAEARPRDASPERFGVLLAQAAVGTRVIELLDAGFRVPEFTIDLDDGVLTWEGESLDERGRPNPTIPSEAEYLGETLGAPEFVANPRPGRAQRRQRRRDRNDRMRNEAMDEVMAAMRQRGSMEYPRDFKEVFGYEGMLPGRYERYLIDMARDGYIERRADGRWYAAPGMEDMRFSEEMPNPACPACGAHIASGASSCPSCGIRVRAGAEGVATPLESPRHLVTRRGRPPGVPVGNPSQLTAKGERMYEDIKRGYGHGPRAKEIAARTVLARAHDVPGLVRANPGAYVRVGRMPTDEELAHAWSYIEREYTLAEGNVDGEQWAEGLAFGQQFEVDAMDRAIVAEMKPQLTEVQWRSIAHRADYLRADQGMAPLFKE